MIGQLDSTQKQVTVIGGGIAGLIAAYVLDQKGFEVQLLEAETRLGGLIKTTSGPFGISEAAAHSILVTPEVQKFLEELDLEFLLCRPNSTARYILRDGKLRRFPLGLYECIVAVLRASFVWGDPKIPPGELNLEEWTKRHLGKAPLEYLINPMLRVIYGAPPEQIWINAAFKGLAIPHYHTFVSALLYKFLHRKKDSKRKKGVMMAPRHGMESVTQSLELRLRKNLGNRIQTGVLVEKLPTEGNIVLTVPADSASKLLKNTDLVLSQYLDKIEYSPLISVTVFLSRSDSEKIPRGIGMMIPRKESRKILGILFNSSTFSERVSDADKWISLTVMLGGADSPEFLELEDYQIEKLIMAELKDLFSVSNVPKAMFIHRWKKAVPKYNSHLFETWRTAKNSWCAAPGHILFGNYTGQVGLRGMIESGLNLK